MHRIILVLVFNKRNIKFNENYAIKNRFTEISGIFNV